MPNNSLKLIEGGIDFVLLEGEAYRGEKWQDNDNLAQSDKRIKALLEDESFRGDAKEAFIQQMGIGWEGLLMGRMSVGWRSAMENLKPWTTKFMNLGIEWGRSYWTGNNGIIYGEKRQHYTMERKRVQEEAGGICMPRKKKITLCSLDCFCGMVDVYNYIIRVVNILTFIYLMQSYEGRLISMACDVIILSILSKSLEN